MRLRSKEVAALSATVALGLGLTACGNGQRQSERSPQFQIDKAKPYGKRLQMIAGRLITLANASPARYDGKPPYTVGFTVPTKKGGTLDYSVQTASLPHRAHEAEVVRVQQSGRKVPKFDLAFYGYDDGTWEVDCHADPFSSHGRILSSHENRRIQLNGKTIDTEPADANALLSDELYNLQALVDRSATGQNLITPSRSLCDVNLG